MVNVDLSPSTVLGSGMVLAALSLWQVTGVTVPNLARSRIGQDLNNAPICWILIVFSHCLQMRSSRPELSKDADVVYSSIGVLVGGILIFQGWRLDPLLLFGQVGSPWLT